MTVDRYTKGVLTVIAACLLWMCAMWAPGTVLAQQGARELTTVSHSAQPVVLVGIGAMDSDGKVMVYYATHNGRQWTDPTVPIHAASPLAVSLPYSPANPLPAQLGYTPTAPLPVQINGVKKTSEWEPIRTQVEPDPGRPKPGGGDRQ
jgi:hypothetical protein